MGAHSLFKGKINPTRMDLGIVGKGRDRDLQLLRFWGKETPSFEVKNRVLL